MFVNSFILLSINRSSPLFITEFRAVNMQLVREGQSSQYFSFFITHNPSWAWFTSVHHLLVNMKQVIQVEKAWLVKVLLDL